MSTYDEEEARADRIHELKKVLAESLNFFGDGNVSAYPWELEGDIEVHGPLTEIIEWAQGWRSEIEELG